ncbi:MAG: hypothetical protein ACR2RB_05970 [Gammaproteobacteria bacterium]
MRLHKTACVGALTALAMSGCGGGSDPAPASTPSSSGSAEGIWNGTTDTSRTIAGIVLDDGTYYVIYASPGSSAGPSGVIQGNGTSNNGNFSSSNTRDFNLEGLGVLSATVSANSSARQSFNGSINYADPSVGSVSFTSTYDTRYDATPNLNALAGTYTGDVASSAGSESASVTVASNGSFTGSGASGCTFTGTAIPRSSGNIFNISISFAAAPCVLPNTTVSGVAFFDEASGDLIATAPNSSRTDGVLFIGTKT